MFAFSVSDKMEPFYQNIGSFPTGVFSFFLIMSLLFWSVAVLGLINIGFLDAVDLDTGVAEADGASVPDGIAGVILKLNLDHVPITISITLIAMFGWLFSYYLVYFSTDYLTQGWMTWLLNPVIFIVSLLAAIKITAVCIRPLRPLFMNMQKHSEKVILGQTVIVRSSRVDANFGEAVLDDGGAGLILKVRAMENETFKKKSRVVLLEYLAADNTYIVIKEEDFLN